jgi:hypothetical protein
MIAKNHKLGVLFDSQFFANLEKSLNILVQAIEGSDERRVILATLKSARTASWVGEAHRMFVFRQRV